MENIALQSLLIFSLLCYARKLLPLLRLKEFLVFATDLFLPVYFNKIALLLVNFSRVDFSCILKVAKLSHGRRMSDVRYQSYQALGYFKTTERSAIYCILYYCICFATFYAKAKGIVAAILDLNAYPKFGPRSRAHLWAGSFALLELTSLVLYYSIRA